MHNIHIVWVGKDYPQENYENFRKFTEINKNVTLNLWMLDEEAIENSKINQVCPKVKTKCYKPLLQKYPQFIEIHDFLVDMQAYEGVSDLLRYLVLYENGGVYVDINALVSDNPVDEEIFKQDGFKIPICLNDNDGQIMTSNKIIFSDKKHPLPWQILSMIRLTFSKAKNELEVKYKAISSQDKRNAAYHLNADLMGSACVRLIKYYHSSPANSHIKHCFPLNLAEPFMYEAKTKDRAVDDHTAELCDDFNSFVFDLWVDFKSNHNTLEALFESLALLDKNEKPPEISEWNPKFFTLSSEQSSASSSSSIEQHLNDL